MNPRLQRRLLRNKLNILLVTIAVIATLTSKDTISQTAAQMSELRAKMQANSAQQMELLASEDNRTEREKVAIARYQKGCIFVVALNAPSNLTALQAGKPVLDGVTQHPIAAGSVVCDEAGNTAEIVPGKPPTADHFAFTGNREVIEAAIKRAGATQLKRTKTNQK